MRIIAFVFLLLILCPAIVGAEGEVSSLKQFEYWNNGNIKSCAMYDVKGRLKAKAFCRYDGTVEKVERFDTLGNRTEEAFYDGKGRLCAGLDGWAAMRWWYEDSRLRSQIAYDEYGKPIERKQYSESGRLVLRQYKDTLDDLAPYEAANMAIMLGGANVRYFDDKHPLHDTTVPTLKE